MSQNKPKGDLKQAKTTQNKPKRELKRAKTNQNDQKQTKMSRKET